MFALNLLWFLVVPYEIACQYYWSTWNSWSSVVKSFSSRQEEYFCGEWIRNPLILFLSWTRHLILAIMAFCCLYRLTMSLLMSSRNYCTSLTRVWAWNTFSCAAPLLRLLMWVPAFCWIFRIALIALTREFAQDVWPDSGLKPSQVSNPWPEICEKGDSSPRLDIIKF